MGFNFRIMGLILVGGLVLGCGFLSLRVKILTLERDIEKEARVVAEGELNALRRSSILKIETIDNARRIDLERHSFEKENVRAIERARSDGNGPLAPVLRDTAGRLRDRLHDIDRRAD